MTDTIPVSDEDLSKILEDPAKYKDWVMEVLSGDPSILAREVLRKLKSNTIDNELDMLLRQIGNIMPYNFIIPGLRDQLGLTIQSDDDCVNQLRDFGKHLDADDVKILDKIITFVGDPDGELEADFPDPTIFLGSLIQQMPIDNLPEMFNCIDYISML